MIEFWGVIGLAALDKVFLNELKESYPHVEETVREYGFRLSRFEMGEVKRLLAIPRVVESLGEVCHISWEAALRDKKACWWSANESASHDPTPYEHPLVNLDKTVEDPNFTEH